MKKKEYKKRLEREKALKPTFDLEKKDDVMKIFKIFIGVMLFISIMFIITKFITGEWSLSSNKNNTQEEARTNKTICGSILSLDETSEYYVLMYDFTGTDAKLYDIIKSNYESKTSKKNLYILDFSNVLNKSCFASDDNSINIVNNLGELRAKDPTLLKIENKSIVDYKVGKDAIKNYFNNL
jgi:hypothetical protein